MKTMAIIVRLLSLVVFLTAAAMPAVSYQPTFSRPLARTSSLYMKRGRGSFQKEIGGGKKPSRGVEGSSSMVSNWCKLPPGAKLPDEENQVGLLDTNLPTLKNSATNPTGAVAAVKYNGNTYCFSSTCPSCKIPLTKAKVVSGDKKNEPKLVCDFCKSTYSLKSGLKLADDTSAGSPGLFGGIMKNIYAANPENLGPLPLYKLGEDKDGNLVIDPSGK